MILYRVIAVTGDDVLSFTLSVAGPLATMFTAAIWGFRLMLSAFNQATATQVRSDELSREIAERAQEDLLQVRAEMFEAEAQHEKRIDALQSLLDEARAEIAVLRAERSQWLADRIALEARVAALESRGG